jgi:putative peptidoglycan lipid II flippase
MFATAIARVLGLLRDMFMAYYYGGSESNAAFATASRIPLVFFDIFLSAAVLGVFIPVYNSFKGHEEKEKSEFANIFLNAVILVTGLISVFGIFFAEEIIAFAMPGYGPETRELSADLLRILFPMIIFTGAVFTLIGFLQSKGEFFVPSMVSAVSNFGIIIYFLFLNRHFNIYGLAWAYLIAWSVQFFTLVIPLIRKKYKYRLTLNFRNAAFIRAVKMALPIMAGTWLVPLGIMIGQHFLSFSAGAAFYVSAFTYAITVFLLVTGIFTHAICNYIFPKLSQNSDDPEAFAGIVKTGFSASCFIIAPVACLLFVLRGEAVTLLFMRGEFGEEIARVTAQMVAFLAPGMIMFSVIEISNRVFYSRKQVRTPMFASLAGIAVNFIICRVIVFELELPLYFITLATLICQSVTAVILIGALKISAEKIFDKKFLVNIGKIVLSSGILLIIITAAYYLLENNAFEAGTAANILTAAVVFTAGVAAYAGANFLLGTDEAKMFLKMVKKNKEVN